MESAKTDVYLKHVACPIFKPNGQMCTSWKCNIYPVISILSSLALKAIGCTHKVINF